MKANRAYRLIVKRGGILPSSLARRARTDRVEVLEIESMEVVLYWELPARDAARVVRRLRSDLAQLDADLFMEVWEGK
jgi:hypothetical protein